MPPHLSRQKVLPGPRRHGHVRHRDPLGLAGLHHHVIKGGTGGVAGVVAGRAVLELRPVWGWGCLGEMEGWQAPSFVLLPVVYFQVVRGRQASSTFKCFGVEICTQQVPTNNPPWAVVVELSPVNHDLADLASGAAGERRYGSETCDADNKSTLWRGVGAAPRAESHTPCRLVGSSVVSTPFPSTIPSLAARPQTRLPLLLTVTLTLVALPALGDLGDAWMLKTLVPRRGAPSSTGMGACGQGGSG
jgi:hypothetical protein